MPPVARGLFVGTILVGSFLLFLVQPMVARMALPRLGGAPNVWNSAMVVYQALLLAGYAYAHRLSRVAMPQQGLIHLGLLMLFAITLPIALHNLAPPQPGWEVFWVPLLLLLTAGPAFFIVAAQAPLMQRWFAAHPAAGEPWALYAASNVGSFAGLIAYPLLAEPLLSLEAQSLVWAAGYGLLAVLVAACLLVRRSASFNALPRDAAGLAEAGPSWQLMLKWIVLSAVPSGLMLSTTTHLTTDIFAIPLLWVIPLGLYLLSFVIAFSDRREFAWAFGVFAPPVMLVAGGLAMISHHSGSLTLALASVMLLFSVATALHAKLYDSRPATSQLTLFYLAMSIGGALGGAFTAILAPLLFDWVWEHPILVLAAALLMPLPAIYNWHRLQNIDPAMVRTAAIVLMLMAALLGWMLLAVASEEDPGNHRVFLTIMISGVGLLLLPWRSLFVAVLAMVMLAQGGVRTIEASLKGERERSYFGIYSVVDDPGLKIRRLVHGTTLHGQQSTDPGHKREPSTYYGAGSGVAIALGQASSLYGKAARIGVVGLGTGTLACQRRGDQRWTFFEIDPAIVEYSRNGTFTYLRDCAPDARFELGDARLRLAKSKPAAFDILVIDAFSSDAIPLHLLTREAFEVYLRALDAGGMAVIHISNRYIALEPVVAAIAGELGVKAAIRNDNPADRSILTPSAWVVISRDAEKIESLAEVLPDTPWDDLARPEGRVWTDKYASILPHIRWRELLGAP